MDIRELANKLRENNNKKEQAITDLKIVQIILLTQNLLNHVQLTMT